MPGVGLTLGGRGASGTSWRAGRKLASSTRSCWAQIWWASSALMATMAPARSSSRGSKTSRRACGASRASRRPLPAPWVRRQRAREASPTRGLESMTRKQGGEALCVSTHMLPAPPRPSEQRRCRRNMSRGSRRTPAASRRPRLASLDLVARLSPSPQTRRPASPVAKACARRRRLAEEAVIHSRASALPSSPAVEAGVGAEVGKAPTAVA
mmetsp:Transcript_54488/g.151879  ORF Transcript_54488/g.151879 Transcript_54488/m.151879 type:complete len:211 (-) Transcript_54488:1493-2125(-)